MITKEQALNFINELLQEYRVTIQLKSNTGSSMEIHSTSAGTFHFNTEADSIEDLITKFIGKYLNLNLFENIEKIPVNVDMLRVGQTYKVHIQEDWNHRFFVAKFLGFDEEDTDIVKFEGNRPCTIFDFEEIYKVNECIN